MVRRGREREEGGRRGREGETKGEGGRMGGMERRRVRSKIAVCFTACQKLAFDSEYRV